MNNNMKNNLDKSTSADRDNELLKNSFVSVRDSVSKSLEIINYTMRNNDNISGVSTGLADLDNKLSGFQDSNLIILAGRPSMGKTAFAANFAFNACQDLVKKAKNGEKQQSVGFFSLERSSTQLASGLLSMMARVNSTYLGNGRVHKENYDDLQKAANDLAEMPLFIDDTASLTIDELRIRARRLKEEENVGIIFVDYLQLLRTSDKQNYRTLEITEIIRELKVIAKDLNIPVVVLSQLSRDLEKRKDKRPRLSDLSDSAAIEQVADVIMLLYREEYYLKRQEPALGDRRYSEWQEQLDRAHNIAEIIVAKHRNGSIGNIYLRYIDKFSSIENWERMHVN